MYFLHDDDDVNNRLLCGDRLYFCPPLKEYAEDFIASILKNNWSWSKC